MKYRSAKTLLALTLISLSGPALAQSVCKALAVDYDNASKNLAETMASGLSDRSVPRATLRAMQDSNVLMEARITLELMKANKCVLPKKSPSGSYYLLDAMRCRTTKLKGIKDAPVCSRSQWTSIDSR